MAHPLHSLFGIRGAYKQRDKLRHYELMKFLGSGSFGSVYSGTWYKSPHPEEQPTPVAIKYIKREDKSNGLSIRDMTKFFFTEVMAMVAAYSLAPFGVIQPFDVELSDKDGWVLIMEKADGSLNNIPDDKVALAKLAGNSITESEFFSERLIMHLYIEPIRAIRLINAAGITHRDIKDDNLLYKCSDEEGCHVKIADFGLSVLSVKDLRLRKAGQSGTEGYHPLSLLRPGSTIEDKKTVDVYAIFASMHDALCYPRGTQIIPEEERNWPTRKETKSPYVPRSWKGGIFDERPISKELDDILKQVLLPLPPGLHVPSMADLDVLRHKWVYLGVIHKKGT
ncbi:MAG: kinase-like domain-containing protein [Piptocephalis tieghemiana]|nr:MAG: kinase-like domain-containing protein [Piptocephalis tieghemiana]